LAPTGRTAKIGIQAVPNLSRRIKFVPNRSVLPVAFAMFMRESLLANKMLPMKNQFEWQ